MEKYTSRVINGAAVARRLQNITMRPNTRYMSDKVISHLKSCPVSKDDITAAEDIYGPNLGLLKGKTPRTNVEHVRSWTNPVSRDILKLHKSIAL
mmetsp:Transcript_22126/g.61496  ORF Transcript_22126/g.61496 Transcript_22126/m.61496 type:complete len:95 (-) Transcript_22126:662-946(-)